MKQSTSFAQVATNQFDYLSSALCANTPPCKKHSSSRKFLTLSISLRLLLVMFLTLTVTTNAWGATTTYTFTSKSWADTNNGWTSGKEGNALTSNQGVQVTTGVTGANATTKNSFTNISRIDVQYCTNASKGAGSIKIQVGSNTQKSFSVTKPSSGGTTLKTATFTFDPNETGKVKITVECTTNSVYIYSVAITTADAVTCTTPPTVSAASSSNVAATTATVSCSGGITSLGSAGCSIESYGFVYGTSSNPTISNTTVQVGTIYATTGTAFSKELTGLTANTTYYVRPYATNGNGTAYGTQTSFKTLELPKYTVTLNAGPGTCAASVTETSAGAGVTLPTPTLDGCGEWSFAGWTISPVEEEITEVPNFITDKPYKPSGDVTLYAVYQRTETTEGVETTTTTTDKLTRETTGITKNSTSYSNWSGKTANSSAVYAGQSAGGNDAIQLRTTNSNSGIITTASGGKAKKITVEWQSSTASGRTLDIYGKNSAYSAATDLYSTSTQGTKLGSIVNGTSTELTITGDYEYIGLRSNSNAMYLTSISIEWETSTGSGTSSTTYYHSTPECTTKTSVTLNPNGGRFASDPEGWTKDGNNYVITHTGTEITLPTNISQEGKIFGGWYKEETKYETIPADLTESITLTAKWSDKQDSEIAWNPTSCNVTIDAGGQLPIFQNPNNLTPITFESSNSEVASVDNNGVITLGTTATTATVTITATFDGNATYAAKEATCTLTVHPSNCRWVETEIGDIKPEDEVLVTMKLNSGDTYTLDHSKGTTALPPAQIIDINGNEATFLSLYHSNSIWNISGNATDGYILYPNGSTTTWLYCTKSNKNVKVGTTTNNVFAIDNGYLKHTNTTESWIAYLGVYINGASTVWHHENLPTATSITGQTLKFYKRECLDATKVWVEGNLTNVTCDTQLPLQLATDGSITLTFTAADGYELPNNVTVTNATKTWNQATGKLTISNPTDNVMVTVEALQVKIVSFSVGNGDTAPAEMRAVENTNITLPSLTTNLTCVKFIGWTDAANDAAITSGNIYKAGDSYNVTQDITLKAVYAAGGGFVLVTDANDLAEGDRIVIAAAGFDVAMGADRGNNRGEVEVTKDNTTITTPDGIQILTLEAGTVTEDANSNPIITYAFNTGSGYLYAASSGSNHLKTQTTNDANGSWTISITSEGIATIKAQGSYTRNWLRYNSGSSIFSCYASGQADVSIYKESITGYTTDPECVMYNVTLCTPTNGTISVDKTIVDPYGSTILTFTPASGYMLDAVLVISGNAEVGTVSYTNNQTSGGTVKISNIQSDIEVCATFKAIPYYKVTFVDMNNGNAETIVHQSEFGGDITAPATASAGCDVTWTFIGWAPSNSLNGTTEVPANLVEAGGTISGANITNNNLIYYSVYSNSSDGTPPFSIGKSGTYYFKAITEDDEVYYATGEMYSNKYRSNQETKIPFYVYYNTTTKKYTIKNTLTDKYVTPTYDNGWANALQEQATFFEWNILSYSNGDFTLYEETGSINSDAKTGEYLFTYPNKSGNTRAIYFGGTYFESSGLTYDDYALYLEPASEMHYYNASSCTELVTMSFDVPADAVLTYADGYPEGYYKDSEKKNVSNFPTLTYEGWTFIGWTAGTSYNDQIGDANLDDENSSPNAPSATIYKTGGETYYLGADVTMYPVFTKFADNEPFDMVNGGDYYIYYIADGDVATSEDEYGASNRIYAGGWGAGGTSDSYGATQSCANATLFTFTKLSNGKWSIYDNTKGKYLCAGATDNNLALNTTTATNGEWTITIHNGNQVNAVSKEGYTLSALSQDAVTGTFKNYATSNFNNNSAYYHRVYVGTCTERVYSSNPSNKPKITLNGTAVVTSTKDQTIRSAKSLSLSAVKLAANGTITLTSDNADVYFSTDKTANFSKGTKPVTSLTINADANGKLAFTTVYVHYKPAAVPTSNLDMQTVTITATTGTDGQPNYATATTTATVRNLPADFVIAAKVNDIWYALPNNCSSTSIVNGLPIDVDDPTNPTSATFAPAEAKWGLKPVYTTSGANDRYADYGEYFVFAEANTGTAGLLYSNKDNAQVQTQGTYSGISGYQEISRYEWIPTTTDLITYQLAGAQDSKQLNINVNGVFGTHSQLVAENELRLLPIDAIYQHAEVQVVEWRADAVVFMYTGDPNHSVTATLASISTTKSLSEIKFDHGVYKMPVSNLLSNAGKTMSIKFHDGSTEVARTEITIPVIINGETNTSSLTALAKADYETLDVVILNGGKLTATEGNAAKYRFRNVTVYGGGKLVIGEGKDLSMASIILRAGGFANNGAYEYVYPQFELKGNLTNTAGKFYYDYITDYDHWYHLVLPFAGDLGTIKYPTEFYGSNVTTSNSGSWIIKRYAGDIRATGNYSAWVDIESEGTDKTTPGVGYIFWGAPKKVTVNGDKQRQKWGIQRISMTKSAGTAKDEEKADKTISNLSSYENVANNSGKDNDQGWNLIGNPYMVNLTDMSTAGLHACKLVEVIDPATGKWNGQWEWNDETNIRYLTIPSDHFDTYTAKTVTQAVPLVAGRAFFVQLEGEANGVTFSAANRASLMPQHLAAQNTAVEVETGIVLSSETMQDEVNFWIKDGKTNDYEYNADYPKTPNNTNFNIYGVHAHGDLSWMATGPEYAEESMPIGYQVPAAGTYTLSISETYYSDILDALYVTDHAMSPELTVDLMNVPYEFSVNQAETNNERFTVSVRLKSENQGPTTGVNNTGAQRDGVTKFIYQDKMFILHNGIIYDATGKQVTTINK